MKKYIYFSVLIAPVFFLSCGKKTQKYQKEYPLHDSRNLFDLNYLYSACAKRYAGLDPIYMRSDAGTPGEEEFPSCVSVKKKLLENNLSAAQVAEILQNLREGDIFEAKQNTKYFSHEAIKNLKNLITRFEGPPS
jgi:hypothetical protein